MKTTNNNRKSKFLALLLSVMMLSSAGALFASCADDSTDSSSSSSSSSVDEEVADKTDDGLIKNANFDFTELSTKTAIGKSVTGWSNSSASANSSKSASGVIDTAADSWKYLTGASETADAIKAMSDADAIAKWDNFTVKDKLAFYEAWKERNKDGKIATDFEKYEAINIDEEDIPSVNPGTRTDAPDSQVLMIHNNYYTSSTSKTLGTAQKFTSSSKVTVPAGSSAKVSVWVKTAELKSATSNKGEQDAVGKGAYISLTHSVGGKSLDAYEVKNINTDEWTQYTFYIKGSYYAETSFSLVLGLGQGTTSDRMEYVSGYAFFDDIQCEIIDNSEYDENTQGLTAADLNSEKVNKTVDTYESNAVTFAMNFYGDNTNWTNVDFNAVSAKETEATDGSKKNPAKADTDVIAIYDNQEALKAATANNKYLKYAYDSYFMKDEADLDFVKEDKILMLLSTNGTAYTVENALPAFEMKDGVDRMAISFFVKTSDLNGGTGAGITLVDGLNKTSFTAIDTSDIEGVKIGDDEDAYDGWQQVFFFLERGEDVEDKLTFSLTFNYGPTDITDSVAKTSFAQGFAAFSKFTVYENMTELEYETAATGTYAKKVTLKGTEENKATGNSGFDTAAGVPTDALEEGLANLQNYKGVYSDSYYVTLPTSATIDESKMAVNDYANAGLLNKDKFAEVLKNNNEAWLQAIAEGNTNAETVWNNAFGADVTQPLLIWNAPDMVKSYGFIGSSKSLSNEYTVVSVRVKTTDGAKASVYVVDMDDATRQTMLSVSRSLTYWYDDDGNVCTGDPSKNSTEIAFKLDKNGLYKANKGWSNYDALSEEMQESYFANLSAYTEKDGILYAAEDSAIHDYYDHTWNREVFYKNGNDVYTEANGAGVKVYDLATVSQLAPRYTAEDAKELKLENIDTNGEWQTIRFFIRKGVTAKNYRLEVWSGSRDGKTVNTAGYVAFDTNDPGSDKYADLLAQYKEESGAEYFESVFSYYDTDKHVRYDESLDADKYNAYAESFNQSSYESAVAYLFYKEGNIYNIFADYSLSDQEVVAQEKTEDTTTDSSEEETEEDNSANVWLLASSISVAAVLVLAVLSIVIRKVVENLHRKNGMKARKSKEKKAAAKKPVNKVDEDSPYND